MVSRWVQWKNDCQISKTGQRLGQNQSANNQKGRQDDEGFCRRHGDPSSTSNSPAPPLRQPGLQIPSATLLYLFLRTRSLPLSVANAVHRRRVAARVPRWAAARAAVAEQEADREGGLICDPGPQAVQGGRGEASGFRAAVCGQTAQGGQARRARRAGTPGGGRSGCQDV